MTTKRGTKARRTAPKRARARRAKVRRTAKRAVAKRAVTRRAVARRKPTLKVVRRASRARRPAKAPAPAFAQAQGAGPKQRLLFDLVRSRTAFAAAIQGMVAGTAERPMGEGKWTVRETVLHLIARDRIRLRELEAVLRGAAPSWRGYDVAGQNRENERDLVPLRHIPWDEAVRLLQSTRRELMESIESIPEEPAEIWTESHPFGWMMVRLPGHDRHHADAIKRWRAESGE